MNDKLEYALFSLKFESSRHIIFDHSENESLLSIKQYNINNSVDKKKDRLLVEMMILHLPLKAVYTIPLFEKQGYTEHLLKNPECIYGLYPSLHPRSYDRFFN